MKKRKRTNPNAISMPAYSGPAIHVNVELVRPLLERAQHRPFAELLAVRDAAERRLAELRSEQPPAASAVADAFRTEVFAATVEHRDPTLGSADVQAAEAAEADHRETLAAVKRQLVAIDAQLLAAIRDAGPELLRVLAVERAGLLAAGGPVIDRGAPRPALDVLHGELLWPPLAYGPGHVDAFGRPVAWWPLLLEGAAWESHTEQRNHWNEWAWQMLARRGGFTITPAGALQFSAAWEPPGRRTGAAVAFAGMPPARLGGVLMIGTGPNGEQGIDPRARVGLHSVEFG